MKLVENNRKVIENVTRTSVEMKNFREGFKRQFGYEFDDQKHLPVLETGFSFKKAKEKLDSMREADSATAFPQLLRAGVQTIVNEMYKTCPTTFEEWTTTVQSKKDTELYAPLIGVAFPREVGKQMRYAEVAATGLDISLTNRKFGSIYSVEWELSEDDLTSQVYAQSKLLGEYMKLLIEVWVYAKLSGAACSYADMKIPGTETKPSDETSYPWSTALKGGGANRPATFGVLSQANIQNAFIAGYAQKNQLGLQMNVELDRLIVSGKSVYDAAVLANSSFFPSATGTAGSVGGPFAINPIKGLFEVTATRYMFESATGKINPSSTAWYMVDSKKPWFICQIRESASVVNEAVNSGQSFEQDLIRFKARERFNADFIEPRFGYQGNDGSVV